MLKHLNTADSEQFRQQLIDFISTVEYSELITAKNNVPHIRPMVYVNDGLTIYMVSRKNTAKVEQIRANPNVSVMIIKSFETTSDTKEVIIEGQASFVSDTNERQKAFDLFKQKPQNFQEWADRDTGAFEVIKIIPQLLRYFDYAQGESTPRVLTVN